MKLEIKELSKRLYFVKGEELKELAELVATCNGNLEYLEVFAKNTGISTTYDGDGAPGITKLVEDDDAQDGRKGALAEDTRKKG